MYCVYFITVNPIKNTTANIIVSAIAVCLAKILFFRAPTALCFPAILEMLLSRVPPKHDIIPVGEYLSVQAAAGMVLFWWNGKQSTGATTS
jgi:hypothetical protein